MMRVWASRLAIATIVFALVVATGWVAVMEVFLFAFQPTPLVQFLLPVVLALSWLVGWQIVLSLRRWGASPTVVEMDSSLSPRA
ncbi:hypothetical protein [Sphingomonas sp.]|jgi:hypothetical protein